MRKLNAPLDYFFVSNSYPKSEWEGLDWVWSWTKDEKRLTFECLILAFINSKDLLLEVRKSSKIKWNPEDNITKLNNSKTIFAPTHALLLGSLSHSTLSN